MFFKIQPAPHKDSTTRDDLEPHQFFDYDGPNSFRNIDFNLPVDFDIQFPVLKMPGKGILTDYPRSVVLSPLPVVSERVLNILRNLKTDVFQDFKIKVLQEGIHHDYYALYFPYPRGSQIIKWSDSVFKIVDKSKYYFEKGMPRLEEVKRLRFADYSQYLSKSRSLHKSNFSIHPHHIKLMPSKSCLFRFGGLYTGHYCTQEFKSLIEEKEFDGFNFQEIKTDFSYT